MVSKVVEMGGVQALIALSNMEDNKIQSEVFKGLHTLSLHQPLHTYLTVSGAAKAISHVLDNKENKEQELLMNGISTLYLLCKSPHLRTKVIYDGALTPVLKLCTMDDTIALVAMKTLSLIVEDDQTHSIIVDNHRIKALSHILSLCGRTEPQIQLISLKILAHISTSSDWNRHRIIQENSIADYDLKEVFNNPFTNEEILRTATCLMANLAACSIDQNGLLTFQNSLCSLISEDHNNKVLCNIMRGIANFAKFKLNAPILIQVFPEIIEKGLMSNHDDIRIQAARVTAFLLAYMPEQTIEHLMSPVLLSASLSSHPPILCLSPSLISPLLTVSLSLSLLTVSLSPIPFSLSLSLSILHYFLPFSLSLSPSLLSPILTVSLSLSVTAFSHSHCLSLSLSFITFSHSLLTLSLSLYPSLLSPILTVSPSPSLLSPLLTVSLSLFHCFLPSSQSLSLSLSHSHCLSLSLLSPILTVSLLSFSFSLLCLSPSLLSPILTVSLSLFLPFLISLSLSFSHSHCLSLSILHYFLPFSLSLSLSILHYFLPFSLSLSPSLLSPILTVSLSPSVPLSLSPFFPFSLLSLSFSLSFNLSFTFSPILTVSLSPPILSLSLSLHLFSHSHCLSLSPSLLSPILTVSLSLSVTAFSHSHCLSLCLSPSLHSLILSDSLFLSLLSPLSLSPLPPFSPCFLSFFHQLPFLSLAFSPFFLYLSPLTSPSFFPIFLFPSPCPFSLTLSIFPAPSSCFLSFSLSLYLPLFQLSLSLSLSPLPHFFLFTLFLLPSPGFLPLSPPPLLSPPSPIIFSAPINLPSNINAAIIF
ncbi:unnamed protein product [Acanthosepion pharaonis]|uniref:ARM repeat superfamily protein n=1 Tax=Acanthosepion pharaonis TaxID=158019 RepID=A0A812BQF4_ACAPH|nr:unnamed protein product [Sepia pharaonis]